MTTLVLRLPPLAAAHPLPALDYVLVDTGGRAGEAGQTQAALLPRADRVIAVVDAQDTTLLALDLPPLPVARLGAALRGALEDRLLQDTEELHLATGPRNDDGGTAQACAAPAVPLQQAVADLARAGREPHGIVPEAALLAPGEAALQETAGGPRLLWRDAQGEAAWLPLILAADAATPQALPLPVTPEHLYIGQGAEERLSWLDLPQGLEPAALSDADWLARAATSRWNLRQFDLAPQRALRRGISGLRDMLASAAWRRVGWMLLLLAAVQLVGMNLRALQLAREQRGLQARIDAAAGAALPGAPAILDAGLQLQRALDTARARAGKPSEADLDTLMGLAATVLPPHIAPTALHYTGNQLQLTLPADAAAQAMQRCVPAGLRCTADGKVLTIAPGGGA